VPWWASALLSWCVSTWWGVLFVAWWRLRRQLLELELRIRALDGGGVWGGVDVNDPLRDGQAGDIAPPP
jgi:hypothetical protein